MRRCLDAALSPCSPSPLIASGSRCAGHRSKRTAIRTADRPIARAVIAASPVCACKGCGLHEGPCGSTEDLTAGHVIPLARGGTNEGPRQTECRRCNSSKGAW